MICFNIYVYLLEMGGQNLFTELKNLSPFPRTDVAKLGSTRKISGISIEKSRKIELFNSLEFNFWPTNLVFWLCLALIRSEGVLEAEFWNFDFFGFFGPFYVQKLSKINFLGRKRPKNPKKMKISKFCFQQFLRPNKCKT